MTGVHEWFVTQREAYVARHLEPDEERLFREHLTGCVECAGEVARIARELALLPMGIAPVPLRPGLVRELTEGVLTRRRSRPQQRWVPLALAASALLATGFGWLRARERAADAESSLQVARVQLEALQDTLSVLRQASKVLHARVTMDGHQGGVTIFADSVSHRWNVVVHGLPPAPAGQRYQFWFICDDGMVRGAEIAPTSAAPVILTLGMPSTGGRVMGASLSVEPMDLPDDAPPRGKELAHMMLES